MSQKKALVVTTKGWSKDELQQFKLKVNNLNFKWEAHVLTKDGKKKFCYFCSKIDLEIMAQQEGYKILKVAKL